MQATPDRHSRQMDIMSPRRLEAIRQNGNKIVGNPKINDQDAASQYSKAQSRLNDGASRASRMDSTGNQVRALAERLE